MDSILIQKQVRDNSSDLHSYVNELTNWENEMKRKESDRANLPNSDQNVPPIRSKVPQNKTGSGDGPTKPKRISAYDYSAWDTFNVEKELEKLDCSEQTNTNDSKAEDAEPMQDIQQNMDLAYREKAKGNEFVKQQNWVEGIKSYTNAINNFQSDPIFYANRALCYLKLNQYVNCEIDCTNALRLDPTYVKALHRRATARIQLNQNEEALEDLTKVLAIEPNNVESLKELQKLEKIIESLKPKIDIMKHVKPSTSQEMLKIIPGDIPPPKTFSKETELLLNQWPKGKPVFKTPIDAFVKSEKQRDDSLIYPVTKAPNLRSKKPLKRIEVKEVDCDAEYLEYQRLKSDNNIQAVMEDIATTVISEISEEANNGDDIILEAIAPTPTFFVPKTCLQFQKQWKMCANYAHKNEFLSIVPHYELSDIFQEFLESDLFTDILDTLQYCFNDSLVVDYIKTFPKIKRFSTLVLFLSEKEKTCVRNILNKLNESQKLEEADVKLLKELYGV